MIYLATFFCLIALCLIVVLAKVAEEKEKYRRGYEFFKSQAEELEKRVEFYQRELHIINP